jgi:hypothetical protein
VNGSVLDCPVPVSTEGRDSCLRRDPSRRLGAGIAQGLVPGRGLSHELHTVACFQTSGGQAFASRVVPFQLHCASSEIETASLKRASDRLSENFSAETSS